MSDYLSSTNSNEDELGWFLSTMYLSSTIEPNMTIFDSNENLESFMEIIEKFIDLAISLVGCIFSGVLLRS